MTDEDAAEVLRRGAGHLPSHAPVADIQARADRLRARHRSAAVVIATALCAAVVVTVAATAVVSRLADDPRSTVVVGGDTERAASTARGPEGCPRSAARPTYLPWVDADEQIPDPRAAGSALRWSTTDATGTATVTLRRRDGDVGPDDGREIPAYVGGFAGRLLVDAAGRQADVVWNLGGTSCSVLELHVEATSAVAFDRPLRTEAVDIAGALDSPGGGFVDWPLPDDAPSCPPPPVRPTRLPWLAVGEDVASPEVWKGGPEDGDGNQLIWWSDIETSDDEPYYVALRRVSEPAGTGGGDATGVVLRGAEGVAGGGPVAGNVWMGWNIGGSSCNLVELELTTSGRMTTPQARRGILRIAESFVPYPDAADGDG